MSALHASYAGEGKYQVNHLHGGMYAVDLEGHTCSCRKWDLCGIPCPHAITAIGKKEHNPLVYVHSCYKRPSYGL
ncbi:hypothetical protein DVH24_031844 [Malus domestica]|uniref:SWIM-type domain-containing protein n=1 Tax=Malus domestica TaxID=3750 RepID=A0A498J4D5_MALDO|nr:hypothetical protein DVH24_031844 [Malus domestica]